MLVGIISDTHGLLRPEALAALQGVELILHGGDVGNAAVIQKLEMIAPVVAVRGNNDKGGAWAEELPQWEVVEIGGLFVYLIHDLKEMDISPAGTFQVVVSGHSHKPAVTKERGVLYVNPGSAGPRRFTLPISIALLRVTGNQASAEIVELSASTDFTDYAD
jgi:putative phosphoesterase